MTNTLEQEPTDALKYVFTALFGNLLISYFVSFFASSIPIFTVTKTYAILAITHIIKRYYPVPATKKPDINQKNVSTSKLRKLLKY